MDPRPTLSLFFKLSIILLVSIPWLYFNIKDSKIINLIIFFVFSIIFIIISKRFYKQDEEYNLHSLIKISYTFSVTWIFIGIMLIYVVLMDYIKQEKYPSLEFIVIISILLLFGLILFYLSNKSRKYEKSIGSSKQL